MADNRRTLTGITFTVQPTGHPVRWAIENGELIPVEWDCGTFHVTLERYASPEQCAAAKR